MFQPLKTATISCSGETKGNQYELPAIPVSREQPRGSVLGIQNPPLVSIPCIGPIIVGSHVRHDGRGRGLDPITGYDLAAVPLTTPQEEVADSSEILCGQVKAAFGVCLTVGRDLPVEVRDADRFE